MIFSTKLLCQHQNSICAGRVLLQLFSGCAAIVSCVGPVSWCILPAGESSQSHSCPVSRRHTPSYTIENVHCDFRAPASEAQSREVERVFRPTEILMSLLHNIAVNMSPLPQLNAFRNWHPPPFTQSSKVGAGCFDRSIDAFRSCSDGSSDKHCDFDTTGTNTSSRCWWHQIRHSRAGIVAT